MGCKGGKDRRLLAAEEHMVEVLRVFMVATQWSVETFSVRLGELASQGWKVRWVSQYGGSARGLSLINVNLSRLFLHSLHFPSQVLSSLLFGTSFNVEDVFLNFLQIHSFTLICSAKV
jgi:hypothetical protein